MNTVNVNEREKNFYNFLNKKNEKLDFLNEKNLGFKEYNNAKSFMNKVTKQNLDPLNIQHIISFNKSLYQNIFKTDSGDKALNIRDFIVNPVGKFTKNARKTLIFILEEYFQKERDNEKELIENIIEKEYKDQIKNIIEQTRILSNSTSDINFKAIQRDINKEKNKIFDGLIKNNNLHKNLIISDNKEDFQIKVENEQASYYFSYKLSSTGINNLSKIFIKNLCNLKKARYENELNEILKDKVFLEITKESIKSYNVSLYTNPNSFLGFWGEIWNTYFVDKSISDKDKKTQQSAFERDKEYKYQAPSDVYIEVGENENKKIYRFQTKEWKKETFLGKRGFQLGQGKVDYIDWSRNLSYYYTKDEQNNILNDIFKPKGDEINNLYKYNISIDNIAQNFGISNIGEKIKSKEIQELFRHLAFGSFNVTTNLYFEKELEGNDFFWLNGKFIPSIYILTMFLNSLKEQTNNANIFIEEKVSKNKNGIVKNYLSVQVSGMSLDFRKKTGELFNL